MSLTTGTNEVLLLRIFDLEENEKFLKENHEIHLKQVHKMYQEQIEELSKDTLIDNRSKTLSRWKFYLDNVEERNARLVAELMEADKRLEDTKAKEKINYKIKIAEKSKFLRDKLKKTEETLNYKQDQFDSCKEHKVLFQTVEKMLATLIKYEFSMQTLIEENNALKEEVNKLQIDKEVTNQVSQRIANKLNNVMKARQDTLSRPVKIPKVVTSRNLFESKVHGRSTTFKTENVSDVGGAENKLKAVLAVIEANGYVSTEVFEKAYRHVESLAAKLRQLKTNAIKKLYLNVSHSSFSQFKNSQLSLYTE